MITTYLLIIQVVGLIYSLLERERDRRYSDSSRKYSNYYLLLLYWRKWWVGVREKGRRRDGKYNWTIPNYAGDGQTEVPFNHRRELREIPNLEHVRWVETFESRVFDNNEQWWLRTIIYLLSCTHSASLLLSWHVHRPCQSQINTITSTKKCAKQDKPRRKTLLMNANNTKQAPKFELPAVTMTPKVKNDGNWYSACWKQPWWPGWQDEYLFLWPRINILDEVMVSSANPLVSRDASTEACEGAQKGRKKRKDLEEWHPAFWGCQNRWHGSHHKILQLPIWSTSTPAQPITLYSFSYSTLFNDVVQPFI